MITFNVGWVLEKIAAQENLNAVAENIDDVCFGMVVSSDKTAIQVFRENSSIYNYQIVDGDPIRLVRRAVNDALSIDYPDLNETECIRRGGAPAVALSRVDPASLPRQVEIQHIDPNRSYGIGTQVARHTAAPTTNTQISLSIDFVISAQQAKDMAFDLLYRIWAQQLRLGFEHPNLQIEPGDTIRLTTGRGVFVCLVIGNTINMPARTNTISAVILLTSKGSTIVPAPVADAFVPVLPGGGGSGGGGSGGGSGGGGSAGDGEITLAAAIAQNTNGDSEGLPKDVPQGFDWYNGYIHDFTAPPSGMTAMTGYGHIYQRAGTIDTTIAGLIEIRNEKSWVQLSDFSWVEVQDETTLGGAHFVGDFNDNASIAMDLVDAGGGIWTMDGPPVGYNNHWWMDPRGSYTANTVIAAFTMYEVRVTEASASGRLVAGAGIDWWLDPSAGYVAPVGTNNPAAGIGNWVLVTTDFKPVCFYSHASSAAFSAHPPPPVVLTSTSVAALAQDFTQLTTEAGVTIITEG